MDNTIKLLQEWNAWEYDKEKMLQERSSNGGKLIMRGIFNAKYVNLLT